MRETYPEVQKQITRECILTALLKLLEKKPFNQITITQITSLAGVSRMAFYRNYTVKEDIIITYLDELFEVFSKKMEAVAVHEKKAISVLYFTYFKQQKYFIDMLLKSGLSHIFYERFCFYLSNFFKSMENKNKPEYGNYLIQFESGGLYNMLIEWIKNDTKESPEDMANLLMQFT